MEIKLKIMTDQIIGAQQEEPLVVANNEANSTEDNVSVYWILMYDDF